jgi:hypothetical protein
MNRAAMIGTPQSVGTWQWGCIYGHSWFVDPVRRLTVIVMANTAVEGMSRLGCGKYIFL